MTTTMALPRHRHQTIADLQHMVPEPLIRGTMRIAFPKDRDLRLHPIVTRPVDAETLMKTGASKAQPKHEKGEV